MCSSVLGLQAVALALTTPVLITLGDVSTTVALICGVGPALAAVVVAAFLRHRWAVWAGHLLQVASLALGLLVPVMYLLGGLFAALWVTAVVLGARIAREKAARSARIGSVG